LYKPTNSGEVVRHSEVQNASGTELRCNVGYRKMLLPHEVSSPSGSVSLCVLIRVSGCCHASK